MSTAKRLPKMALNGKVADAPPSTSGHLHLVSPASPALVNGNVARNVAPHVAPPRRRANRELRTREHLTPSEVDKLIEAARRVGRHGHRDAAMILLAYRHGLRVGELVALRRDQTDLQSGLFHVTRLKRGIPSTHPLRGPELRALRQIQRDYPPSSYVFVTERGGPLTGSTVRKIIARAGRGAKLGFPVHPHMLRHATGYYLANGGQDTRAIQAYLGHANITHTTRYTELAPDRFKGFWRD